MNATQICGLLQDFKTNIFKVKDFKPPLVVTHCIEDTGTEKRVMKFVATSNTCRIKTINTGR